MALLSLDGLPPLSPQRLNLALVSSDRGQIGTISQPLVAGAENLNRSVSGSLLPSPNLGDRDESKIADSKINCTGDKPVGDGFLPAGFPGVRGFTRIAP